MPVLPLKLHRAQPRTTCALVATRETRVWRPPPEQPSAQTDIAGAYALAGDIIACFVATRGVATVYDVTRPAPSFARPDSNGHPVMLSHCAIFNSVRSCVGRSVRQPSQSTRPLRDDGAGDPGADGREDRRVGSRCGYWRHSRRCGWRRDVMAWSVSQ